MLILASRSPRRAALLLAVGLDFEIDAVEADETFPAGARPDAAAVDIAGRKLDALLATGRHEDRTILAADTMVVLDGRVFGKPADPEDAKRILGDLAGKTHRVITGVVVQGADGRRYAGHAATDVDLAAMRPAQIEAYVATGEPLGKAGAYAIQGAGAALVRSIRGDHTNVVGLPIRRTLELLHAAGHPLPAHLRPG